MIKMKKILASLIVSFFLGSIGIAHAALPSVSGGTLTLPKEYVGSNTTNFEKVCKKALVKNMSSSAFVIKLSKVNSACHRNLIAVHQNFLKATKKLRKKDISKLPCSCSISKKCCWNPSPCCD